MKFHPSVLLMTVVLSVFIVFIAFSPATAVGQEVKAKASLREAKRNYAETVVDEIMRKKSDINRDAIQTRAAIYTDKTAEVMKEAGVLKEWILEKCNAEIRKLQDDFNQGKIAGEEMAKKMSEIYKKRYPNLAKVYADKKISKKLEDEFYKIFPEAKPEEKPVKKAVSKPKSKTEAKPPMDKKTEANKDKK